MILGKAEDKVTIHEAIDNMFEQVDANEDDKVSFKEFSEWCYKNMTPGLVTWIWEIMPREKSKETGNLSPRNKRSKSPSFEIWSSKKSSIHNEYFCMHLSVILKFDFFSQ